MKTIVCAALVAALPMTVSAQDTVSPYCDLLKSGWDIILEQELAGTWTANHTGGTMFTGAGAMAFPANEIGQVNFVFEGEDIFMTFPEGDLTVFVVDEVNFIFDPTSEEMANIGAATTDLDIEIASNCADTSVLPQLMALGQMRGPQGSTDTQVYFKMIDRDLIAGVQHIDITGPNFSGYIVATVMLTR
ncbi:hypothetical protein [Yoonia sp. 208BN28-4]|uniref:hypothetical protein n=1 Tax=Yoonia sp. 208BN28-4 TaxID=3126505 RepID=UPI00309688F1